MTHDRKCLDNVPDRVVVRQRERLELRRLTHFGAKHAALLPGHFARADAQLEPHGVSVADRVGAVHVREVDQREDRAVAAASDLRDLQFLERLHAHLSVRTADHHQMAVEELERDAAPVVELGLLRVEIVAQFVRVGQRGSCGPDFVFARLPQPYRRVVKVLERDILDASWELIKQQSARFKAEVAAALAAAARSTRSSALNNSSNSLDQAAGDPDDCEAAKKRCCKSFVRRAFGDSLVGASISQHPILPMTLAALEDNSGGDELQRSKIVLQLFNTTTHEMIAEHTIPVNQNEDPPPESATEPWTRYEVTRLTPIRVCSATQEGAATTSAACAFGIQLTESTTTPANGDQPEGTTCVTSISIYQFRGVGTLDQYGSSAMSAEQPLSFQLVAAGKLERSDGMELSPGGQYLALSTVPGSIAIHEIPNESALDLASSTGSGNVLDLSTSLTLMRIENGAMLPGSSCSASRAHFVVKPVLAPRSSQNCCFQPVEAYAIVVCHETKVLKYILRSPGNASGAPATPRTSWNHLAAITTSAVDSTTQYLVVGLANGSLAIWDTLEEIDHASLSPSAVDTLPSPSKNDPSVDVVLTYRDEFVVVFSAASQQVRFFDIKNRTTPQLLRVVSAPAPSAQQKEGVKIVALVETASILDVPIAMIGYSNGLLVLYDMRNAEAIGSIRYRSSANPKSSDPSHSQSILASQHGIAVAQASSLDFYGWHQLLLASFPSFDDILQQRNLAQDSVNAKRLFLSSIASPLVAPLVSLSGFSNDSIDRMLRRTAGSPTASSPARTAAASSSSTLADQRQHSKTGLGALASSDSSTSIGHQNRLSPGSSSPADAFAIEQLPSLPEISLQPSKQSAGVRFGQYWQDPGSAITKEKEAKMHRHRKELIKALTTGAW